MATYTVISGDTFESIARKVYGTELDADLLTRANPGAAEPLAEGVRLIVPKSPTAPPSLPPQLSTSRENEVSILIEGERFRFWDQVEIVRSIDSMDTVQFSAPFDPDTPKFAEIFQPFSFKDVAIIAGDSQLFTGTMVGVSPRIENTKRVVSVSGYSTPGVLNDCTPPASAFPLEFNGQGLREIATTLARPFGISVEFNANQGSVFDRVACAPQKKVLPFLIELAKQRNLIISSTPLGALVFWQSVNTGNPVAVLNQGESPVLSVAAFFNPQSYYSHITALEPVVVGLPGGVFTVKNPRLQSVVRPFTFEAPDTLEADIKASVEAKAGRMFGNMASYLLEVSTWRDSTGALWRPNTTLTLQAPGAMIYDQYEFIIRSVNFRRESNLETAALTLSIPGSFSGVLPERLPWEE